MTIASRPIFPGIVFALIGMNMTIVGITVWLATSDPSVAVEPDYYRKAAAWDQTADQQRANARLGWKASAEMATAPDGASRLVSVRLVDRNGAGVLGAAVTATLFHNARAGDRIEAHFTEASDGVYLAPSRCERPGVWRLRLAVSRGLETFTDSMELQVTDPSSSGPNR